MNNEQFNRETAYQITLSTAKNMLRNGIITAEEFSAIDTILLEKYRPLLGSLYAENRKITVAMCSAES
jgi:hypothetical protein